MVLFVYLCTKIAKYMRKLLILMFLLCLMSCKTVKYIDRNIETTTEIEVPITDTKIEYRDRLVYDSIYFHDSIYTYINKDTVIKYKEKISTRYINKTDTIVKTDTIKVPVTITKTVTQTETKVKEVNRLYWWQKGLMYIGLAIVVFGVLYVIIKIKKFI